MSARRILIALTAIPLSLCAPAGAISQTRPVPVYSVVEIPFTGPSFTPAESPARDVELRVTFVHESGSPTYRVYGFWDGGRRFAVRFTPTRPGRWKVAEVHSNRPELEGQKEGTEIIAVPSELHGFWEVDAESPGQRWYRRSDGSHQYVVGNTLYSFLSETYLDGRPNGSDIASDVRGSAEYFKKIRFSAIGDLYPHPTDAPFLDDDGKPTTDGSYSHRPNPAWFRNRTDLAVKIAFDRDLIADLIMAGVDTREARSALRPAHNGGDPEPFLRYLAARYGSYPNVWLTLINEYDIRTPKFTPEQIIQIGLTLRKYLPYPTPVSVHRTWGAWRPALNSTPSWNDHVIIQEKLRDLSKSTDAILAGHEAGGGNRPVINDELSYEGAGDEHSRDDAIESHLGAFLGGGYGTTGYKSGEKLGQYFTGRFDPSVHTSTASLKWLRERIDEEISFWRMEPVELERSIFSGTDPGYRAMQWAGLEYVLGTDAPRQGLVARLPPGKWEVRRLDAIARTETVLARDARGAFTFSAPDSRAALLHFRRVGD